ncbi:hypothetical protein [Hyalangium gracile]|nr:hypothetical protein [Hyalangium gracile]
MQNKKLSLKKEQIRTLNESEVNLLDSVVGGTVRVTIEISISADAQ